MDVIEQLNRAQSSLEENRDQMVSLTRKPPHFRRSPALQAQAQDPAGKPDAVLVPLSKPAGWARIPLGWDAVRLAKLQRHAADPKARRPEWPALWGLKLILSLETDL